LDPEYGDAPTYVNLPIRERADLPDSAAGCRHDIDEANS